ncbi:signal peptidase I [Bacillus sp. H-16]|uniref:signal peptidase I SipW n=1 Tax=Alteribacter salitolerans TaxID=2912333 RepID=UPI001963C81C|nr:signal peptidase I [Alteribacter salitolerans]MBM7097060.1 signal peptidase I [Alteribacter salitolerans]
MGVKILKGISTGVNVLLFGLLIITAVLVLTSLTSDGETQIFGKELKVVYSGSMEPEIQTGAVIGINPSINKESLSVDDVIMFQQEEGVFVTHRIIDVINNNGHVMYQTKGDNNEAADTNPVLSDNVYGLHDGINVPYLGYAMDFANSQFGLVALLIIPGIMLLMSSARTLYSGIRELNEEKRKAVNEAASSTESA